MLEVLPKAFDDSLEETGEKVLPHDECQYCDIFDRFVNRATVYKNFRFQYHCIKLSNKK